MKSSQIDSRIVEIDLHIKALTKEKERLEILRKIEQLREAKRSKPQPTQEHV